MSDTKDLVQRLRWMSKDTIGEQAADALERVTAERDALKADAERLGWLLDNAIIIHMRHGVPSLPTHDREGIDAAMKDQTP